KRFLASPQSLVLGARTFTSTTPLRSRFGNMLTRRVLSLAVGHKLVDTQTGLRAIPRSFLERILALPANGYEFELEMLIATRQPGVQVAEPSSRTIYAPGSPTSHFQPLRDSMRIFFALLRFAFSSLLSAALDNITFYFLFRASGIIAASLAGGRLLA